MTVRYRNLRGELPAATAAIMLELAAEYGLSPPQVLAGTAVDEFALSSPTTTVARQDSMKMLGNCLALSGEPAFALEFGSRITPVALGAVGYALMCCDDLDQLLGFLLRYHRLLVGNFSIRIEPEADGRVVVLEGISPEELQRHECEVFFAAAVATLGRLMPGRALGLRASFRYPEPSYSAVYRRLICTDLEFGAPGTRLWLARDLLDLPLQFANPTMLRLYQQQCDALLVAGSTAAPFTDSVRRFLLQTPGHFPGIDGAAAHFHMSARTLRRRLEAEGLTYQHIVHELRRQLAETYLRDSMLSISEIAQMLGYGDVSNFRRAFISWTGKSPAACRREASGSAVRSGH